MAKAKLTKAGLKRLMAARARKTRKAPSPAVVADADALAATPPPGVSDVPVVKGMSISDAAVMRIVQATTRSAGNLYGASILPKPPPIHYARMSKPMPGVLPMTASGKGHNADAKRRIAMDDAFQTTFYNQSNYGFAGGMGWLGYQYLAELTQRPEFRRISEVMAREMTRKWIKLKSTGEDEKTDEIKALEAAMKEFGIQGHFAWAAENDGYFGRAQLFIDLGDEDDPDELKIELQIAPEKVTKGGLKGFRRVEPMWSYPYLYNSTDPLKEDFFKPISWFVMAKTVHASRLMTFIGREMPDILKPAYQFGGLSLSQMALPYVDNWLRTRQSVSNLVKSFSVMVLLTNMGATLTGGSSDDVLKRMAIWTQFRDNSDTFVVDKDSEEFKNVSAPIAGLDKLQAQSQEQMASVSGEPLVVLTGITPAGLNASSDGEIRVWYQTVHAAQEKLFTRHLSRVIELIQLHLWGKIDKEIGFEYVPLWQLDEAGQSSVRKTDMEADAIAVEGGILHPAESRKRIANQLDSPYQGLDVDDVPEPPEDEPDPSTGGGGVTTGEEDKTEGE